MNRLSQSLPSLFFISFFTLSASHALTLDYKIPCLAVKNGILFFESYIKETVENKDPQKKQDKKLSESVSSKEYTSLSFMRSFPVVSTLGEKVVLNNSLNHTNPLYKHLKNAQEFTETPHWNFISFFGSVPLIVTAQEPNKVFCVTQFDSVDKGIIKAFDVKDKNNQPATIIGLGSNVTQHQDFNNSYVFTAVKGKEQSFGDENSALVRVVMHAIKQERLNEKKEKEESIQMSFEVKDFLSVRLDSPFLSFNGPLEALHNQSNHNPVCFHWCDATQTLYGGFAITTGLQDNNGGFALARVQPSSFKGKRVIPHLALKGQKNIIGAQGSSITACVHKIDSMITHTHLPYLIIQGGVGEINTTQGLVYALPLVGTSGPYQGMIASKNSSPVNHYSSEFPFRWITRYFTEPVRLVEDMYTDDDNEVKVGARPLGAAISSMEVRSDAVFISTIGSEDVKPGVYFSQALFHSNGTIKAWTAWKKIAGNNKPVINCWHDAKNDLYFTETDENTTTIQKLVWKQADILDPIIHKTFKETSEGIQGFYECVIDDHCYMLLTGEKRLVLFCGTTKEGYLKTHGYNARNASLRTLHNAADTFIFSGGVLDILGTIKTATIVHKDKSIWIVVGGQGGVAVLSAHEGKGFLLPEGLTSAGSFKKYGSYQNVRKVIFDKNMLYILTNTQLERVAIDNESWLTAVQPVTLASPALFNNDIAFFDCLISGPSALVGTNRGLLKAIYSVQNAHNMAQVGWSWVPLGEESEGAITHLTALSPTLQETDFAEGIGGMVFAVNNSITYQKSRIYRLSTNSQSYEPCLDCFVSVTPAYFMTFPLRCSHIMTDGISWLATLGYKNIMGILRLSDVMNGKNVNKFTKHQMSESTGKIARMCYSCGLQKWILVESFHLYTYE
jgi:hypothetical protein